MPASRKPIDEALAMAGVARGSKSKIASVTASIHPRSSVVRTQSSAPSLSGDNHSGAETDERLIELWLARYDSPHTKRAYETDTEHFLVFVGSLASASPGLSELTVAHVVAYLSHLREEVSPATQARHMSSLKSLLSFAFDTGYVRFNVGAAIKAPKFHDHIAERILTVEQVRAIVGAARPGRDRAFVKFLYFAGARVGEACQLQWRHVREDRGTLRVTLHGKGNKSRHIPLPPLMIPEFEGLGQVRLGKYVFESCYGNALDPKDGWRIVRKAAENAYLRQAVSPHWLRHAHATHALRNGAPANVVKDTLGHSSLATTGRYAHIDNTESSGLFLSL